MPLLSADLAALLVLIEEVREQAGIAQVSGDEEFLLASLVLDWHEGRQVTVGQVMDREGFRTRTYAYRRLVALRKFGWVVFVTSDHDQRVKYVEPSDKTRRYFEKFSHAFDAFIAARRATKA